MIRGKSKMCPFGLPVTYGCKCAGGKLENGAPAITFMSLIEEGLDQDVMEDIMENNWEHLEMRMKDKVCPYADMILDNDSAVDCKYDPESRVIPAGNISFNGSPSYPHLYVGNTPKPQYGYPMEYNSDDNESRTIYHGLYSLIG